MKKFLPLICLSILALSACTTPVSELEFGEPELGPNTSDRPISGPDNVEPQSPEAKARSQEIARIFDGKPLAYLQTAVWHPSEQQGIGYWQGEWDKSSYSGLAAWGSGGFPYERGGALGSEKTSIPMADLKGPYLLRYMCQGAGQVELVVAADGQELLRTQQHCEPTVKSSDYEFDVEHIEKLVIEQNPQPGTHATFEYQLIQ